jgi:hypothetical protein
VRFHERIRLAGDLIEEIGCRTSSTAVLPQTGPNPITYFEITTAAAFVAFAETPADMTLLEVGLGGRLDATNVVDTAPHGHHAGRHGPPAVPRRHAGRRSPPKRRASSSAASPLWSAASRTTR